MERKSTAQRQTAVRIISQKHTPHYGSLLLLQHEHLPQRFSSSIRGRCSLSSHCHSTSGVHAVKRTPGIQAEAEGVCADCSSAPSAGRCSGQQDGGMDGWVEEGVDGWWEGGMDGWKPQTKATVSHSSLHTIRERIFLLGSVQSDDTTGSFRGFLYEAHRLSAFPRCQQKHH